jgi:hypothetical protein
MLRFAGFCCKLAVLLLFCLGVWCSCPPPRSDRVLVAVGALIFLAMRASG